MNGVAIYMEGGGDGRDTKAALRQGMDVFLTELKNATRKKSWHWKLVCCGGRDQAYKAFTSARTAGQMSVVVLLVDAEGSVSSSSRAHLTKRDKWKLDDVGDDVVHLMIQTMEAWIVADPQALTRYYGQRFKENLLPKTSNLETVAKNTITSALAQSTDKTQKGAYHKTRHAGDLLERLDPQTVKQRCPACKRMFAEVGAKLGEA